MFARVRVNLHHRISAAIGEACVRARHGREGAVGPLVGGSPVVDHWSLGSIGPSTAAVLARMVAERRPKRVLECGPGLSTVVMARTLALIGSAARIVSLEHDERWAELMRRRLRAAGVRRRVDLLVGGLMATERERGVWYGRAREAAALGPFDFVFIDGPPATDGRPRRAPILPLMWDAIADGATIVLDDGHRGGERSCVEGWLARFDGELTAEFVGVEKGLWVLEKRAVRAVTRKSGPWRGGSVRGAQSRSRSRR